MVVAGDGAVEDRRIEFSLVSAADCAKSKRCSEAALRGRGRLTASGDKLQLSASDSSDGSLLPSGSNWTVAVSAGNRLMTLRDGDRTLALAKVEPDRLRGLRAAMIITGLPAEKRWRCFLANATANDAAFALLRKGKHVAPSFLNDFVRIASYRVTLTAMAAVPTADDPERGPLTGVTVETLMLERFKDVDVPRTTADARRYRAQAAFIDQRSRPPGANVVATAINAGTPVTVAATGAEFAALVRLAARDAEAKRLFCAE